METTEPKNYGWKIIPAIVILILVVVFSVQNSTETLLKLWFWEGNAPLVLLLVFSFVLGLLFTLILIWPVSRHSKRKTKLIQQLEQRVNDLEKQLSNKPNQNL